MAALKQAIEYGALARLERIEISSVLLYQRPTCETSCDPYYFKQGERGPWSTTTIPPYLKSFSKIRFEREAEGHNVRIVTGRLMLAYQGLFTRVEELDLSIRASCTDVSGSLSAVSPRVLFHGGDDREYAAENKHTLVVDSVR